MIKKQINLIAVEIMKHLCNCPSHGYSQYSRNGDGRSEKLVIDGYEYTIATGDRDCSSAVIDAWSQALKGTQFEGALSGATYTGNMRKVFVNSGLFEVWDTDMTWAEAGDVYLNDACHTAMCINGSNPDLLGEFSISENGTIDGQEGDQTGWESHITSYYNFPWDCTLHYNGKADYVIQDVEIQEKGLFMSQEKQFMYVINPEQTGHLFLIDGSRVNHIPNTEALKYLQQEYKHVTGLDIEIRELGTPEVPEGFRLMQSLGYENLYKEIIG